MIFFCMQKVKIFGIYCIHYDIALRYYINYVNL